MRESTARWFRIGLIAVGYVVLVVGWWVEWSMRDEVVGANFAAGGVMTVSMMLCGAGGLWALLSAAYNRVTWREMFLTCGLGLAGFVATDLVCLFALFPHE